MSAAGKKLCLVGAILLGLASAGCISFSGHFGTPIRVENLPRIEAGVTTREEVIAWFGPPSAFFNPTLLDLIVGEEDEPEDAPAPLLNDVYTYRYTENESTIFFLPIFFGLIDTVAVSETLTIFFDESGRVEYHAYRRDVPWPGKDD